MVLELVLSFHLLYLGTGRAMRLGGRLQYLLSHHGEPCLWRDFYCPHSQVSRCSRDLTTFYHVGFWKVLQKQKLSKFSLVFLR